jgi:hypothetical protein
VLTTILLTISTVSLGQGIPNSTSKRDTNLVLPKVVGQETAKDLLRFDSLQGEYKILNQNYELERGKTSALEALVKSKDQQLTLWGQKEQNWNKIDSLRIAEVQREKETANQLAKDLRKTKRNKTYHDVFGGAIIGGLLYLLVTK